MVNQPAAGDWRPTVVVRAPEAIANYVREVYEREGGRIPKLQEIAEHCGVDESTASRWRPDAIRALSAGN